jgi:zinc protease
MIETITAKELHEALAANWSPDHRLILVSGNLNLIDQEIPPENQILNTHAESARMPVEKLLEKDVIKFPYLPVPDKKGAIRTREEIADLGIIRVEFVNGVKLNIKKTDFKANQVLAAIAFGDGKSSEPFELQGLAILSQKIFNLSGLGTLNRDELQKALAGKNTSVSFQVDEEHFILSGQAIPDEIPLLFQLYQAYLFDPGFREDAYTLALNQIQQEYESLMNSIEGGMPLKGANFLAGGDSRFGFPEFEKLKSISLEDIRHWIQPNLTSAPLEISIAGDVDVESVIGIAATYMGTLPARRQTATIDKTRLPKFPAGESLTVPVPTKIDKGMVDVAFPTGDFWDIRRNRRLSILSEIFSDRMRIRIRDEMGAAYTLDAYNAPSRAYSGYGVLHAVVSNNPKDAQNVIKAVKGIVDDMVQNGIRSEEFDRALKPTIEQIKELVKTNTYWLNSVLNGSSQHPEQLDWSRNFQTDYAAITLDEVYRIAKEYLKNQSAAVVIIEPEKME